MKAPRFTVHTRTKEGWHEVPVGARRGNQYVRTSVVVAIPMNEDFQVMSVEEVPSSPVSHRIAEGKAGDYLVLDNGIPRAEEGNNFRATHAQVPVQTTDDLATLRVTIERIIASRVEFPDDNEAGEIADLILATIGAIEVQP